MAKHVDVMDSHPSLEKTTMGGYAALQRTFTKPMSLAYSRKHCLQMFRLYLRMIPHWLAHTRLQRERRRDGGREKEICQSLSQMPV